MMARPSPCKRRSKNAALGGRSFGSGSSREQAATAPAHRGIRVLIAASFSQTYKHNAFNNGFVVFECPELVDDLKAARPTRSPPSARSRRRSSPPAAPRR
jgi:homoaconitate hydratase